MIMLTLTFYINGFDFQCVGTKATLSADDGVLKSMMESYTRQMSAIAPYTRVEDFNFLADLPTCLLNPAARPG